MRCPEPMQKSSSLTLPALFRMDPRLREDDEYRGDESGVIGG